MKNFILMLILITIFTFFTNSIGICKSNDESVTNVYKKICWLLKENTDEIFLAEYGAEAFNYGIEILKKSPKSQEAYYSIFLINSSAFKSYLHKINEIFIPLNNKHYPYIDDPNFDESEKLIYLILYSHGIDTKSIAEQTKRKKKTFEVLKNMQENCKNRDYAALATAMLFLSNKIDDRLNYINYFIKIFPDHPAISDVKFNKILNIYDLDKISSDKSKIKECIFETNKLINDYGNIKLPEGWSFSIECYGLLIYCYKFINDKEKALKYYGLIEKEAPNYWLLKDLKNTLENN